MDQLVILWITTLRMISLALINMALCFEELSEFSKAVEASRAAEWIILSFIPTSDELSKSTRRIKEILATKYSPVMKELSEIERIIFGLFKEKFNQEILKESDSESEEESENAKELLDKNARGFYSELLMRTQPVLNKRPLYNDLRAETQSVDDDLQSVQNQTEEYHLVTEETEKSNDLFNISKKISGNLRVDATSDSKSRFITEVFSPKSPMKSQENPKMVSNSSTEASKYFSIFKNNYIPKAMTSNECTHLPKFLSTPFTYSTFKALYFLHLGSWFH